MKNKARINPKEEEIGRKLTFKELAIMNQFLGRAFAFVWSLTLLASNRCIHELGEHEADLILSGASLELEQMRKLLNEGVESLIRGK